MLRGKVLNATEAKNAAKMASEAAVEVSQNRKDVAAALKQTKQNAMATRNLSKEGNKSKLIQIGISLIVFPEPTPISETVGSCFVAAGLIQQGIKKQAIYLDDIPKNLQSAFKEIHAQRNSLKL